MILLFAFYSETSDGKKAKCVITTLHITLNNQ